MVWSDVLWPADMPTFGDVTKATSVVLGGDPDALGDWQAAQEEGSRLVNRRTR